jgi:hypothetical protein
LLVAAAWETETRLMSARRVDGIMMGKLAD